MFKYSTEILGKIIVHGLIAFGGGAAHYLSRAEHPRIINFLIAGAIGSFTGVLFGLLVSCFTDSQYMITAVAGIGGWMGRDGMDWLSSLVKKLVNKKIDK